MKDKHKQVISVFLNKTLKGRVLSSIDCIDGTLFLVKRRHFHWLVWIHKETFTTVVESLMRSTVKFSELLAWSAIPGDNLIRPVIKRSLPSAPSHNLYLSSELYLVRYSLLEINRDGSLGKILTQSLDGITKISTGVSSFVKKTFIGDESAQPEKPSYNSKIAKEYAAVRIQLQDRLFYALNKQKLLDKTIKGIVTQTSYSFVTFNKQEAINFLSEVKKAKFHLSNE
jgi:hypothetical protein